MNALTLTHSFGPALEVLKQETADQAAQLTASAAGITITDAASMDAAQGLVMSLHQAGKALEARRVELKTPLNQMGKAIETIIAGVADPVERSKKSLAGKISAYDAEQRRAAAEAENRRQEEIRKAEAARAAEQRRLQAEADAKHAEEVRLANLKAAADAADLADLLGTPVEAKPVEVAPAPKVELPPVAAPQPVAALAKVSAVTTAMVQVLVCDNPNLLPRTMGGEELWKPDHAAIKRVIASGVTVPGYRMERQEQTRVNGRAP